MTQSSQLSPGLDTVKTIYRDQTTLVHLPCPDSYREAKNSSPRQPSLPLGAGSVPN